MGDLITSQEIFNLFNPKNFKAIREHKRAKINNCAGFLEITTTSEQKLASAGFRVLLGNLEAQSLYQIEVEAQLLLGDKAFIYCETQNNERVIPRNFLIKGNDLNPTFYQLYFIAPEDEKIQIGILFYNGNRDYQMHVTHFKVKKILNSTINLKTYATHFLPKIQYQKISWIGLWKISKKYYIQYLFDDNDKVFIFLPKFEESWIDPRIPNTNIIYNQDKLDHMVRPSVKKIFKISQPNGLIVEIQPDGTLLLYFHDYRNFKPSLLVQNIIIQYSIN